MAPEVQPERKPGFWTRFLVRPVKDTFKKVTSFHFEGRRKLNRGRRYETYDEVIAPNSGWTLLPTSMAVFHDNGRGKAELKFVHEDGREAVFDGDNLANVKDPLYVATYNYVNPMAPSKVKGVGSALKFAAKNTGHFFADVLPFAIGGNVRGSDKEVQKRRERYIARIERFKAAQELARKTAASAGVAPDDTQ